MNESKRLPHIKMIPIDKINILNPRERNKKRFLGITNNIAQGGLKRPITVVPCRSGAVNKDYDLVCGQGRLEAFVARGRTHIPAHIIDVSEEEALIMSLVENFARRPHRTPDVIRGIELLQRQGYDEQTIAQKTGLSLSYVKSILKKIGEEHRPVEVKAGNIHTAIAIKAARSPDNKQRVLRKAYESKKSRGGKLHMAKCLLEQRRRDGKTQKIVKGRCTDRNSKRVASKEALNIYLREIAWKRLFNQKAATASDQLSFLTKALRCLLQEESFNNLLRAEGLLTFPKPLAGLIGQEKADHA